MTGRERWFALALRAYPRAYRAERGDEIMATLVDSTETATWWSVGVDGLDLVVQGTRKRMRLGPDRYAGQVLLLAALPGFVVAAAYAVVQLVFGEVVPSLVPHFGPFQTVGAAVYLTWILGALGALVTPRHQRPLAALCIAVTVISVPVGDAFFARPTLRALVVLVGLGVPSVFAPSSDLQRLRSKAVATGAGLVALALLIPWAVAMSGYARSLGTSFYGVGMFRLTQYLPYAAAAGAVIACLVVVVRRTAWLGAGALVLAPWFAAGAAFPYYGGPRWLGNGFDALVLCIIAVWLGAKWALDVRTPQPSDGTMESGHPG